MTRAAACFRAINDTRENLTPEVRVGHSSVPPVSPRAQRTLKIASADSTAGIAAA
jgi:hypothetical protein